MRVLAAAAALLAAGLVTPSCGGGSSPTGPSGPDILTITITRQNGEQSFSPNPAAAGGRLVVFRNADSIVHRVRLNDGTIDTGNIGPGTSSAVVQMPAEGTNYHC